MISPVGAIVNGLELMEDGADQATTELALDLIRKSARTASARLQFCRIAFGAAGSAGSAIDTRDAHQVATNFLNDDRTTVEWHVPPAFMPKNRVKLLLNLLLLAGGAIPRGGTMTIVKEKSATDFEIEQNLKTWPSNGARTIAFDGKTGHLFAMAAEAAPLPPGATPPPSQPKASTA